MKNFFIIFTLTISAFCFSSDSAEANSVCKCVDDAFGTNSEVECGGEESIRKAFPDSMIQCTFSKAANDGSIIDSQNFNANPKDAKRICGNIIRAQCK